MAHNLPTVAICCTNMHNSVNNQFLILVNMQFVTKVIALIWYRVQLLVCPILPLMVITWSNAYMGPANPSLRNSNAIRQ